MMSSWKKGVWKTDSSTRSGWRFINESGPECGSCQVAGESVLGASRRFRRFQSPTVSNLLLDAQRALVGILYSSRLSADWKVWKEVP